MSLGTGPGPATLEALLSELSAGDTDNVPVWLSRLAKVDLGFTAVLGGSNPNQVALRANGTADDARLGLSLTLTQAEGWQRYAPIVREALEKSTQALSESII